MLVPVGEALMAVMLAPSRENTSGAYQEAAPLAQSKTRCKFSSRSPFCSSTRSSTYSSRMSVPSMLRPKSAECICERIISLSMTLSISSSRSSCSFMPPGLKNLIPFSSTGLCDAEITTPASAFNFLVIKATPGVVMIPKSITVAPLASMPAVRALCSICPD